MVGGPAGAPVNSLLAAGPVVPAAPGSARSDDRRRRLSLATTPSRYARFVIAENQRFLEDPNNDANHPTVIGGRAKVLPVEWCLYSRPGSDPMQRIKENQDAAIVLDGFGGDETQMFFGVFDGHGPNGCAASTFVRSNLPQSWENNPGLSRDPLAAMSQGCIRVNRDLSAPTSGVDVYVSGSTGIMGLLRKNQLFVANVGDSRAVLGRETAPGRFSALELSHDHKPDRPDEAQRINARGGRVFEWGVPRVWLADVDMPGLAMSRSFGDAAAESVGVFAEPELTRIDLGADDRFIIWASDGVWEFITSEVAVQIVAAHLHEGTSHAAAALVRESTRRWQTEEDVVDDTTVIIVVFDRNRQVIDAAASGGGVSSDVPAAPPSSPVVPVATAP